MTRPAWVVVGAEVFVRSGSAWNTGRICRIERVLPSGRFYAAGILFNENGRERGGGTWHRSYARPVEGGDREEIERHNLIGRARQIRDSLRFDNGTPIETLRAFIEATERFVAPKESRPAGRADAHATGPSSASGLRADDKEG